MRSIKTYWVLNRTSKLGTWFLEKPSIVNTVSCKTHIMLQTVLSTTFYPLFMVLGISHMVFI